MVLKFFYINNQLAQQVNLCREFPYNTLIASLYLEGDLISPQKHNSVYIQEAQELEKKAYIPLAGDVSIDEITDGYKRFF